MTVEIAERLASLRRSHGYSQEELADKIGVSRQAVSKWERTESSPDTDNLIALASLYGISLDELLGIKISEEKSKDNDGKTSEKNVDDENEYRTVEIDAEKFGEELENRIEKQVEKKFTYRRENANLWTMLPVPIIITTAYLVLGFTTKRGWAIGWTLFLLIPVYYSLIEAIRTRNCKEFSFPVLVVFVYLLGGMHWGLWHPYWLEFFLIPIYYPICDMIRKSRGKDLDDDDDDDIFSDEASAVYEDDHGDIVKISKSTDGRNKVVIKSGDDEIHIND